MNGPGQVHMIKLPGSGNLSDLPVRSFEANLHVLSHVAEQVGDFIFVFSGLEAPSPTG